MFKASKVEKKTTTKNKKQKQKRNKPTYRYANKSLFVQNFRPLFIAVSWAIVKMR